MEEKRKVDQTRFMQLCAAYASIQPKYAPDFEKHEVAWYWYQEFKFRSLDELKSAFDKHIRKHSHFPSIKEVHEALTGNIDDDTQSKIVAMNIIGAIQKYGWPNWKEAKEYIGEVGVKVVDRFGGWPNVCEMLYLDNITYFQNQLREMVRSYLASGFADTHVLLPEGKSDSRKLISDMVEHFDINKKNKSSHVISQVSDTILSISDKVKSDVEEIPW